MLNRDDILGADDLARELVAVPEWGGEVYVRCLTGSERAQLQQGFDAYDDKETTQRGMFYRDMLIILALCDERNKPFFTWEDREAMLSKSAQVLERLFIVALRLNRLRDVDVEIAVKNLEVGTNGVSGSGLP